MAKKILIIEDDKFLRELLVKKLRQEGYEILEAVDGEEGYKKAVEEKPDLILLDFILPNMDGFEVLAKIKGNQASSSLTVIVLSNLGQKEEMERAMKLGAIDYLIKAYFTPNEIVEKIKTVLG